MDSVETEDGVDQNLFEKKSPDLRTLYDLTGERVQYRLRAKNLQENWNC